MREVRFAGVGVQVDMGAAEPRSSDPDESSSHRHRAGIFRRPVGGTRIALRNIVPTSLADGASVLLSPLSERVKRAGFVAAPNGPHIHGKEIRRVFGERWFAPSYKGRRVVD